ncbi:MAG: hypothetical protein IJ874_00190 [Ruminococcus sp.]|nr:hypothetical protein [Ruminococcus sp.]
MVLLTLPFGFTSADESTTPELFFGNSKFNGLTIEKNVYRNPSAAQPLREESPAFYSTNFLSEDEYAMLLTYSTVDAESLANAADNALYTREANTGGDGWQFYYSAYLVTNAFQPSIERYGLSSEYIYTIKPTSRTEFQLYHYDDLGNLVKDKEVVSAAEAAVSADAERKAEYDAAATYIDKFKVLFPAAELVIEKQFALESSESAGKFYMCDGDRVKILDLKPGFYYVKEDISLLTMYNRDHSSQRTGEYDPESTKYEVTNTGGDMVSKSQLTEDNVLEYDVSNYFDSLPTNLTVRKSINYFGTDQNPMSDDIFHFRIKVNEEVPSDLTYQVFNSDGNADEQAKPLLSSDFTLKAGQYIVFEGLIPKTAQVDIWEMLTDDNGKLYHPQYSPLLDSDYTLAEWEGTNGAAVKAVHRSVVQNLKSYTFTNIPNALVIKKQISNPADDENSSSAEFTYRIMRYAEKAEYDSAADQSIYSRYQNAPVYTKAINAESWSQLPMADRLEWEDQTGNKYIYLGYTKTYTPQALEEEIEKGADAADFTAEYPITQEQYDTLTDEQKQDFYILELASGTEYITLDSSSLPGGITPEPRYRIHLTADEYSGLDEEAKAKCIPYHANGYTRTLTEAEYYHLDSTQGWIKVVTESYIRPLTAAELLNVESYIYNANSGTVKQSLIQKDEFVLKNNERCLIVGLPYGEKYMVMETKATDSGGADITSNYVVTSPEMPFTTRTLSDTRASRTIGQDQNTFENLYQPKSSLIISKTVYDDDDRANPDALYLFRLERKMTSGYEGVNGAEFTIAANSGTTLNPAVDGKENTYTTDSQGYFILKPNMFGSPVRAEFDKLVSGTYRAVEVHPNARTLESYKNVPDMTAELKALLTAGTLPFNDPNALIPDGVSFFDTEVVSGNSAAQNAPVTAADASGNYVSGDISIDPDTTNNHAAFTNTVKPVKYRFEIEKLLYKDDTFGRPDPYQRFVFKVERFAPDDDEMKTVLETFYVNMCANDAAPDDADYTISERELLYRNGEKTRIAYPVDTDKTRITYNITDDGSETYDYETTIYQGIQTVAVQKKGWYRISEVTDWSYTDHEYVPGTNKYSGGKMIDGGYTDHTKDTGNTDHVIFSIAEEYDTSHTPRASFSNVESIYAYKSGSAYAENTIRIRDTEQEGE